MCAQVETFSTAFTSLPFVMSWRFVQFVRVLDVTFLYMIICKVDEAASTNFFFFFIIYNSFHIASQL